jgi:tetratricopeptide (TPR) repeat protein
MEDAAEDKLLALALKVMAPICYSEKTTNCFRLNLESTRRCCLRILHTVCLWVCVANGLLCAQGEILRVNVQDFHKQPIFGVQIEVEGDGGSAVTDVQGKARIRLPAPNKSKDWVSLEILKSPPGRDLVMVSPWDSWTQISSFENESDHFAKVVVVEFRDRAALKDGSVLAALTAKINKANGPKTVEVGHEEDPKTNLAAVAKQYGLNPEELDKAIRSWGRETTDPYDAGLAALYQRNYRLASAELKESLQGREEKLAVDWKAVTDAAFFLGQSLYEEGKYKESAEAFRRCLQLRPDDATVLNNLGINMIVAGDYVGAEPLLRRALALDEAAPGSNHPDVATELSNLGLLLQNKGDYAAAEPLFRRVLAIHEKALGPNHPGVAADLSNLALLLQNKGDYAAAEPLFRRVLAIHEKALGPNHPDVTMDLNNLALLLKAKSDYAGAEPLLQQALVIDEKRLGSDHPNVATDLNNLASIIQSKGDYAAAEPLYRRALAINEKALGPNHPDVATSLNSLASLLQDQGDYVAAEPLYRRALTIDEKALGPDHPEVATDLNNLASLLQNKGDYAGAEPLYRRALAIREKTLGTDHADVATSLNNLASLLQNKGDYAEAEPLYQRALAIDEKALGPNDPVTLTIRTNLQALINKRSAKEK